MEPWTPEWKQYRLDKLQKKWSTCSQCPISKTRTNIVFGSGNPDADILFVGEAPGEDEDKQGLPFVGRSGDFFNTLLEALDESREDYYLTNIIACRPPNNRDPIADERKACHARLNSIIYIVDPLIIVPIGKYALNSLIGGRDWGIERYHGCTFSSPHPRMKVTGEANGTDVIGQFFPRKGGKLTYHLEYEAIPIYHPSYILRMDSINRDTMEFEQGGLAHQTVADLEKIFSRLNEIRGEHQLIERLLERR